MNDTIERVSDLMTFHKELEQEELFLNALLNKIDKQIHALQVEQLHLLNTTNQSDLNEEIPVITGDAVPPEKEKEPESSFENGNELDLRPINKYDIDEESEEEDIDDKDEECEFPGNSADFDYL